MAAEWLLAALPLIKDVKISEVLREQVTLLVMQRADAIRELEKADLAAAEAKEEILVLKAEVNHLKDQLAEFKTPSDLKKDAKRILVHLFTTASAFDADALARGLELGSSVCQYHLEVLLRANLIEVINWVKRDSSPARYKIAPAGLEYVMEHGLA